MWPVSARFLDALTGSHEAVTRARLFNDPTVRNNAYVPPQFTTTPVGGVELPVLGGAVKLTRLGDVKATLDLDVPGDWWDRVQPYGAEIFVERGIDFGDGTQEYAPLGWFRVQDVDQDDAPDGPINLAGRDRTAQLIQNRMIIPFQLAAGTTHRAVFDRLVNGDPAPSRPTNYGAYAYDPIPITFTGYDPDAATLPGAAVVFDDTYEFLAELIEDRGCVMRFDELGTLRVELRDGAGGEPVFEVAGGPGGNLTRAGRSTTREGVYNVSTAYTDTPTQKVFRRVAYNNIVGSPLRWNTTTFGVTPRFFSSPLLRWTLQDNGQSIQDAAETILSRYTRLPSERSFNVVPNPALRPNDMIRYRPTRGPVEVHRVEDVTIPLAGGGDSVVRASPIGTA